MEQEQLFEQGDGQTSTHFHCELHGTQTACPFKYMSCFEPGDSRECKGHLVARYLQRMRESGEISGPKASGPVTTTNPELAPWLRQKVL